VGRLENQTLVPSWTSVCTVIDPSVRFAAGTPCQRHDGYQEAVLAHLTLLLVDVSRLAADVVSDLRLKDEPLLAEVFGFIEDRYKSPSRSRTWRGQ
jgi:hypothetical protein